MKQQNKDKSNGSGRKAKKNAAETEQHLAGANQSRMTLAVGEPWNEPINKIEVQTESSRKDGVNVLFAWGFMILLFALTAHAMITGDQVTLKESLDIDRMGLGCVAVWAGGKAVLKVLSGWHDNDHKKS